MLAEVTDFELWQRAVRDQFRQGESMGTVILGVGCLVGIIVVFAVIARIQSGWNRKRESAVTESHPQKLFTHLLCALGFTVAQRQLLESIARDSALSHPTSLLISDVLFDQSLARWSAKSSSAAPGSMSSDESRSLTTIRSRLFPEGRGMVQSSTQVRTRSGATKPR